MRGAFARGPGHETGVRLRERWPVGLHGRGGRVWCWMGLMGWTLTLLRPTVSNGDAVVYLQQALEGRLDVRSVHAGYVLSLHLFLRVWQELLAALGALSGVFSPLLSGLEARPLVWSLPPGLPALPDGLTWTSPGLQQAWLSLGMQLHAWSWGGVAVGSLCRLCRHEETGPGGSLLPGLLWLSCPPVLAALTTGEVESMAWGLGLLSLSCWREGQRYRAGLLWGLALTVTPLVVTFLPAYAWVPARGRGFTGLAGSAWLKDGWERWQRPWRWDFRGEWLGPMLLALLPLGLVWSFCWHDWWLGPRGVLSAPEGMGWIERLELRLGQLPPALGLSLLWLWPAGGGLERARALQTGLFRSVVACALLVFLCDRYRDMPAWGFVAALLLGAVGASRLSGRLDGGAGGLRYSTVWIGCLVCVQLLIADQAVRRLRRGEAQAFVSCLSSVRERPSREWGAGVAMRSKTGTVQVEGQPSFSERQRCDWYSEWVTVSSLEPE